MHPDYTAPPSSPPASHRAAEALIFPEPPSPDLQLVRVSLPGGQYTSTGWFPTDAIGAYGKGRTADNCARINALLFDADMLPVFKARYLAAGKEHLGHRVAAWKAAMYAYSSAALSRAMAKHGAIVYAALVELLGEPTAIVDSGWGWHFLYALADDAAEPGNLGQLSELHDVVRPLVHRAAEEAWGGSIGDAVLDSTQDAGTRIVRTWGSTNSKAPGQPRVCRPVYATTRRLTMPEVRGALAAMRPAAAQATLRPLPGPPPAATPAPVPAASAGLRAAVAASVEAPAEGEPVDFHAYSHEGESWFDIACRLQVGETVKVCCPFAGSSVGSGFISKKSTTRALFRSNALSRTFWSANPLLTEGRAELEYRRNRNGEETTPRDTIRNVRRMLEGDPELDLWTCSFRRLPMFGDEMLHPKAMVTRIKMHAEDHYNWKMRGVHRTDIENCIMDVCAMRERNGVAELIEDLTWDGVCRLDEWLPRALGLEPNRLLRAYSRRWLIGLVARVMEPGVKMDNMLVLMGVQGFKKSTLFKRIAAFFGEDLHTDTAVRWADKDSRDVLRGTLVYEDAELESFTRAGVALMKNVLSESTDTYRPAFGRTRKKFPRTAVLVGTANPQDILKDSTGNRRFWLVNTHHSTRDGVDLDYVSANMEQLVAEALFMYRRQRESPSDLSQWWLTPYERELQREDNQQAMREDLMLQAAERVFEANAGGPGSWFVAMDFVTAYAAAHGINSPSSQQLHGMVQRASRALISAGFERQKVYNPATGTRARWYIKRIEEYGAAAPPPDNGLAAIGEDYAKDGNVVNMRSQT